MDYDVVALGELLVDFTPMGAGGAGNPAFEMNPGGAPANVLSAVCALGGSGALIGAVGQDAFGKFLIDQLTHAGVDARGVVQTPKVTTTLAFVHLGQDGERSFSFVRDPGADTCLTRRDVDASGLVEKAGIFHFGSLSLTHEPSRDAAVYAVERAKALGIPVSFDPNYRAPLWQSEQEAVHWMRQGLHMADIAKLSEEELHLLTGHSDIVAGADEVLCWGVGEVYVTLGAKGCYAKARGGEQGFVSGYAVQVADTTGCGDAFMGALLYLKMHAPQLSCTEAAQRANAVGALCATRRGGIPAMPSRHEVEKFTSLVLTGTR